MNKSVNLIALSLLLSGCGPKYEDGSHLHLYAGTGIKGVLEIGMTHDDVRRRTRDLVVHKGELLPWEYEVPSLGASWQSGGACSNDPLGIFVVFVGPASGGPRFNGWFESLALTNGTVITEDQVRHLFGEPNIEYNLSVIAPERAQQTYNSVMAAMKTNLHSSVICWPGEANHLLTYPTRGVFFSCISNTVYAIGIGRPAEQGHPTGRR